MAPGARCKSGAPIFEPEVFRKQMYCIEESTCDIVGTFRGPHSDSAPGELCPLVPLVTPLNVTFSVYNTAELNLSSIKNLSHTQSYH